MVDRCRRWEPALNVGYHRQAGLSGEHRCCRGESRPVMTSGNDQHSPPRQASGQIGDCLWGQAAIPGYVTHVRMRRGSGGCRKRLAEREVDMDRCGGQVGSCRPGPQGHGCRPACDPCVWDADVVEQANRVAVQLRLVDGLIGPGPAHLGGTIRRQHKQGNTRGGGFYHCRVVVRCGRAGCGDRRSWQPRGLGDTEGEETAGPLVEHGVGIDPRLGKEGKRQRRIP